MLLSEVVDRGEKFFSEITDASLQRTMGGLGGCMGFDPDNFSEEFLPYIKKYNTEEGGVVKLFLDYLYDNHLLSEKIRY